MKRDVKIAIVSGVVYLQAKHKQTIQELGVYT